MRMNLYIFALVVVSLTVTEATYRVVNGSEAKPDQFPYQAAIFHGERFVCGGSIIHEKYILTAGHCVREQSNISVLVGTNSFTNGTFYYSKRVIKHEDYWMDPGGVYAIDDIALIELTSNIQFGPHVQKISLHPTEVEDGSRLIISGRGSTKNLWSPASNSLLFIYEKKLDSRTCKEYLHHKNINIVTDGIMCAEAEAGQGACAGDSGGPLVLKSKTGYTQVGIASFIFENYDGNCALSTPTTNFFTKVSYFLDWIQEKVDN